MISDKLKSFFKINEFEDLGFGTKPSSTGRLLNRDGSFNLKRKGLSFKESFSPYHWLKSISWKKFFMIILLLYFLINLLYACVYYFLGVETHLKGAITTTELDKFLEAFFFSAQTLTTVGYGRISPVGFYSSIVATLEALTGLLSFALITGILYGRFSKPNAKILFSENAILAPYRDTNAFMFRIANGRSNQLIEIEVQVTFSFTTQDSSNMPQRRYAQLKLERDKINFFPMSWTIVHPIDHNSPLEGLSLKDLEEADAEFFIIIKAFDDTFCQTVYSRGSYKYTELLTGVKFVPNFESDEHGGSVLFLDKLNDHIPAPLNVLG